MRARNGMVSSGHWLASLAGIGILQAGGNAADAAVAVAATLGVVEPTEAGPGGSGYLLYHEARTGNVYALDYIGRSPRAAEHWAFASEEELRVGPKASIVPGAIAGWLSLLERFGSMDRAEVFRPAITYAEEGFPISEIVSGFVRSAEPDLRRHLIAARTFLPHGRPPRPGEVIVQSDLARTLRTIVEGGAEVFYRGPLGQQVVDFLAQQGGLLDAADLADYQPVWQPPLTVAYRGLRLHTSHPPGAGLQVLQTLKMLEADHAGPSERFGPDYMHHFIEAIKLAVADRVRYTLDPQAPLEALLSDEYAARQRARIDSQRAGESVEETRQERMPAHPGSGAVAAGSPTVNARDHTTHFNVVDRAGNAVSVTQSVGAFFGSGVVAGDTGLVLNNILFWFDLDPDSPNAIGPNRQLDAPIAPVVALRDGRFALAIGTPGGRGILQTTAQLLVNALDTEFDLQVAVEAPRFRVYDGRHVLAEDRFPDASLVELRRRQHEIELVDTWAVPPGSPSLGAGQGVAVDSNTGVLIGAADPRRDSYAIGW